MKKQHMPRSAQRIAQDTADQYFRELTTQIQTVETSFVDALTEIHDAVLDTLTPADHVEGYREHYALQAGYLLGVEVGKRLAGGAR